MRPGLTKVRRRHHGTERRFDRAFWVGQEAGYACKRLVRFGVKHMKNGADQECVTGLFPVIAPLQRSLRVDQHIGNVLDIAHLPFAAANLQQWIVGG